jgi:KDO2-lipid IV(A) lauroyltransferase
MAGGGTIIGAVLKYELEYLLTRLVGFFAKLVPLKLAHFIGDRLGDLFFWVIRIRKKVALRNLEASFSHEKSERELKQILHRNYRHFGRVLMEFAQIPLLKRDTILERIPIHNIQLVFEAIGQGKGLMILSGHFGNWEYMAAALANVGPQLYCVFKEQKNLAVDNIIKQFRMNVGLRPFKVKGGAAKGILNALKEKNAVLILIDQDAGRKGEMIKFLGRPASTARGPALIAIKHRVPVIMAFGIREKDGLIRVHLEKFPDIDQFSDNDEGVKQFLIGYNKILEQYIRQYPAQWFWLHRRWKTQLASSKQ